MGSVNKQMTMESDDVISIDRNFIDGNNSPIQTKLENTIKTTFLDLCRNLDFLFELIQNEEMKTKIEQLIPKELQFLRYYGLQI
jgi:hypothetical protein